MNYTASVNTILIPTHDHAAFLPFAIESALAQNVSCEVLVVGDGVGDDTRAALEPYPVRFFDFPKGARHGEAYRHQVLAEAQGEIICYLGDDDLLFPNHVQEMARMLRDADFTHSLPMFLYPDGVLQPGWMDLSREVFREHLRSGSWNQISLTGAAHTLAAYRRLPYGWRPAPEKTPTDLYMWQQFLDVPGMRLVSGTRCTHLKFTEEWREEMSVAERVRELVLWTKKMNGPYFKRQLIHLEESSRSQSQSYEAGSYTCLGP